MKTEFSPPPKATASKPPAASKKRVFDPLATKPKGEDGHQKPNDDAAEERPLFNTWTLGELKEKEEPEGWNLVGDYHVTRGSITILAGSPGIGKSFATLMLGIQGAIGSGDWLGYAINCRFKTLIIQAENNLLRLIMDAKRVNLPDELDDHLKILEFEWGNVSLDSSKLVEALRKLMADFEPDLVVIDPWNQFAADDKPKETKETLDNIKRILDAAKKPPACMIVAHHRKKREGDAHKGRQMADLIAGSYIMHSNPRCVLCYVAYDPSDENDNRVVVLCPKKNNGEHKGPATAWTLCQHGFESISDFDYKAWQDGGSEEKEPKAKIQLEHLRTVFADGAQPRHEITRRLMALCQCGDSAVSDAIGKTKKGIPKGRLCYAIEEIGEGLLLDLKEEYKEWANKEE